MKNVLHLCESSETGGAESVLISIAECLDRSKYASIVCLLSEGWVTQQLDKRGIENIVIPQPRSLDLGWLAKALGLLKRRRIDVMHSHEFATNAYAAILSRVSGTPFVATVHGKNHYADRWRRRAGYRYAARHGTMVPVSEDLKKFLVEQLGIPANLLHVVHNGIDLERYRPERTGADVRLELGIRPDQPVVGTVGNLFAVKGQIYLLRALAKVVAAVPDVVLLLAGEGDQIEALQREVGGLGLQGHVRFLGFRSDVPRLLEAFDVFVLPSLSEGLPLSILEALAYEKPVVASNVGGVSEIIEDGVSGLLVPPMDRDALADKVVQVLKQPALSASLGKAGRRRVESDFSLEQMLWNYDRLYEGSCG